jgi:ferritin
MAKSKNLPKVIEELVRQFNLELAAAHSYLALSVWCEVRNFKGFARYFVKQAGEERMHAEKIIKHLTDRGATPEVAAVPAPKQDFKTLLEVAQQAQT